MKFDRHAVVETKASYERLIKMQESLWELKWFQAEMECSSLRSEWLRALFLIERSTIEPWNLQRTCPVFDPLQQLIELKHNSRQN